MSSPGEYLLDQQAAKAADQPVWNNLRKMEFHFEENGSTGYIWQVDSAHLSVLGDGSTGYSYSDVAEPDLAVGSPGMCVFRFDCTKPTTLSFELRRPWEHDKEPIRKVTVKIE